MITNENDGRALVAGVGIYDIFSLEQLVTERHAILATEVGLPGYLGSSNSIFKLLIVFI